MGVDLHDLAPHLELSKVSRAKEERFFTLILGSGHLMFMGGGTEDLAENKVCFQCFVEKMFVSDQCFIKSHLKWSFSSPFQATNKLLCHE